MFNKLVTALLLLFMIALSGLAKPVKGGALPPAFVETTKVKKVLYPEQILAVGTLISMPGIIVKPEIAGRITNIYFKSGSRVAKGTQLIQINQDIIKANFEAANAELKLNKLSFERATKLYKTRDIAKSDFDQAQANYRLARAKVDSANAMLKQTTIIAPFAGKLGLNKVNIGDWVNPGQEIVSLQAVDSLKVDFSIPETYQNKVAINQVVYLRSEVGGKKFFKGYVEAVESLINDNNRTLNVRASVPNSDGRLIPGSFVEVLLRFANHEVITIPQTAVVYDIHGNYVFKVVEGKAVKTKLELGKKDNDNVIVKSGLNIGDVIVTAGQMKVHPNGKVVVIGNKTQKKAVSKKYNLRCSSED